MYTQAAPQTKYYPTMTNITLESTASIVSTITLTLLLLITQVTSALCIFESPQSRIHP